MTHAKQLINQPRKFPFINLRLTDYSILDTIVGRYDCESCNRSRKFFCYTCYKPVGDLVDLIPRVQLPIQIDIIKHKKEIDGKSTAVHAAVLAPDNVKIYTYPDIPDYYNEREETVLIFPSAQSVTICQLFEGKTNSTRKENNSGHPKGFNLGTLLKNKLGDIDDGDCKPSPYLLNYNNSYLPIRKAVFIDSTWNQSRGLYKDLRIKRLRTVVLQNRCSQFWRYQKGSPRWYLSTIEAIHQFLLELHVYAWGLNINYQGLNNLEFDPTFLSKVPRIEESEINIEAQAPYNGQYDNLMFFFANMYDLIHKYYDHNELKSYQKTI